MIEAKLIADGNGKRVYRDGDRLLKMFGERYTKADVLNEASNLARVEVTGLNVPKLLEVSVIDGDWTIVSEFVEGETLAARMENEPDRYDEYLSLFIDLQLEIHSKTCPELRKLRDNITRRISDSAILSAMTAESIIR